MKKLVLLLGCFILFTCTTEVEVEVENPINSENVKRISELETLLASLNSTLSQSENQNLLKEVNDLKEQLNQALTLSRGFFCK